MQDSGIRQAPIKAMFQGHVVDAGFGCLVSSVASDSDLLIIFPSFWASQGGRNAIQSFS